MAIIQVTPELLQEKATEVRNLKATHDDTMGKLKTLVYALNENWKGEAQDAFVAKYESMQSTFTQFTEMLEGYASLMDTSAKTMLETDLANKTKIQGFGN